jgi:hypothetical protein
MVGVRTSSHFYRRGVSNNNSFFGFAVQGNYPIIQPQQLYRNNLYITQPVNPINPINPNTPIPLGSILFDGSQNYLTYDGVTLGTNPFTIQCWFNSKLLNGREVILGATNGTQYGLTFCIYNNAITIDRLGVNSTSYAVPTMLVNNWYYLVYVRDADNNATVFLNGTRSSSGVQTDIYNYAVTNNIGCWKPGSEYQEYFNGSISNLCVTLTALYSTSSTTISIPTNPLVANSNTLLLLNTTSQTTSFIDSSPNAFIMTSVGTPPPQVSTSPFL